MAHAVFFGGWFFLLVRILIGGGVKNWFKFLHAPTLLVGPLSWGWDEGGGCRGWVIGKGLFLGYHCLEKTWFAITFLWISEVPS